MGCQWEHMGSQTDRPQDSERKNSWHSAFHANSTTEYKDSNCFVSVGFSMPIPILGLRDINKVFKDGSCLLTNDRFVLVSFFITYFEPLTIIAVIYILTISAVVALQTEATLCLDQLVLWPKLSTTMTLGFFPQTYASEKHFFRCSLSCDMGGVGGGVIGTWVDPCGVMGRGCWLFVWVGYLPSAIWKTLHKTHYAAFFCYISFQYRPVRKPQQLILVNTIPPLA
ncbi:5-hydroxytryptamine receptor 2A-like [Salvelinus fontinalis]|uniref:5-hydroxytryptamine receptor 2A-like n=1 Tax=Salvelinus fontinalis TaxID=8038 RepID=UPI0024851FC6|nr:5-hydroxytryptamine receptor 2A-like [Salvelinus fontinalis]